MTMTVLTAVLSGLGVMYAAHILYFYRGLFRIRKHSGQREHSVCIVITARNEEQHIGECLRSVMAQEYPHHLLSIIVIDDQSTDRTAEIVRSLIPGSPVPLTLLSADTDSTITSPKLRAMSLGIAHTRSEIIATTDADCMVQPQWIRSLNSCFDDRTGVVTGVTVYTRPPEQHPLFFGMQHLDFLSYTAIAAAAIGNGNALVSLGSNMAFRVSAFHEAGGFGPLTNINTGDDSLLSQRIVAGRRWTMQFAAQHEAIVTTWPAKTPREALHQRMRWVGQTAYYPPAMMVFLIGTFLMFLLLLLLLPVSLFTGDILPLLVLLAKTSVDYLVMEKFTRSMGIGYVMRYFLPTALIHIPFVIVATIGGYFFSFEWKERTMKKETP